MPLLHGIGGPLAVRLDDVRHVVAVGGVRDAKIAVIEDVPQATAPSGLSRLCVDESPIRHCPLLPASCLHETRGASGEPRRIANHAVLTQRLQLVSGEAEFGPKHVIRVFAQPRRTLEVHLGAG